MLPSKIPKKTLIYLGHPKKTLSMTSFFLADQKMGLIIYLIIHIIDIYSVYIQYIYIYEPTSSGLKSVPLSFYVCSVLALAYAVCRVPGL